MIFKRASRLAPVTVENTTTIKLGKGFGSESEFDTSVLDQIGSQSAEVIRSLPRGSGMLVVLGGAQNGARFLLDSERTLIGRSSTSDLILDDVTVSRQHAIIMREKNEAFSIHDQGSLNGTYHRGVSVTKAILKNEDEIQIGKFHLIFFQG